MRRFLPLDLTAQREFSEYRVKGGSVIEDAVKVIELVDCLVEHEQPLEQHDLVNVKMPAEPLVVLHRFKYRIEEHRRRARQELMAEPRYQREHTLRHCVGDDVIDFIPHTFKIIEGVLGLDEARLFTAPPAVALGAPFLIDACRTAEGKESLALYLVDLASHQMYDVLCVGMHLHPPAEHLRNRLTAPPRVIVVIAVNEKHLVGELGEPFHPVGVFAFLAIFIFCYVLRSKREPEVPRHDQIVVFVQLDMVAFQLLVGQLAHIHTAVSIAC